MDRPGGKRRDSSLPAHPSDAVRKVVAEYAAKIGIDGEAADAVLHAVLGKTRSETATAIGRNEEWIKYLRKVVQRRHAEVTGKKYTFTTIVNDLLRQVFESESD